MKYKYQEIKEYFEDFIKENEEHIKEDNNFYEDLHHECFNTHYYIIGNYKATSDPEKIVNMYVYIIGEEIVYDYKEELEKQTA